MRLVHKTCKCLHKPSNPVSLDKVDTQKTIDLLTKIMLESKGIGIAAPQVGISKRLFLINPTSNLKDTEVFINPVYVSKSSETEDKVEGCLSYPNKQISVKRHGEVTISYIDLAGNSLQETFTGLKAQIVQHEMDHLDGITIFTKEKAN